MQQHGQRRPRVEQAELTTTTTTNSTTPTDCNLQRAQYGTTIKVCIPGAWEGKRRSSPSNVLQRATRLVAEGFIRREHHASTHNGRGSENEEVDPALKEPGQGRVAAFGGVKPHDRADLAFGEFGPGRVATPGVVEHGDVVQHQGLHGIA